MGLFNFFRKDNKSIGLTTDNGVLGPAFLDGLTEHIENPKNLLPHEWRRRIKTPAGQTKFKIRFYGQLHEKFQNLIVGNDFAPALVFAIDSTTGQEILLFDGCRHGYNALFCDTFTNEQVNNRPATNYYRDRDGNDTFEIIISTYNGINYEEEFSDRIDESGLIELFDGSKTALEKVKRNGFDSLQIWVVTANAKMIEIVSEELA